MATKNKSPRTTTAAPKATTTTATKKTTPATAAKKTAPAQKPTAKKAPAQKATARATTTKTTTATKTKAQTTKAPTTTRELAALIEGCREALEVKIPEQNGIAVRLATRQIELPMLVHVGELTVFDLYPFRFVGVDAKKVDWVKLVRLCRQGYVQLGLDNDFDDADVLVYSFHMPLGSLDAETIATVISTLTAFAEDNYDEVLQATGLVEKKRVH